MKMVYRKGSPRRFQQGPSPEAIRKGFARCHVQKKLRMYKKKRESVEYVLIENIHDKKNIGWKFLL
jgi:hypothetical protein